MLKYLFAIPQALFYGIAGIAGIGLLILIHELGHFSFCKLFGVRTPTFSIGFGPRILTKKIGATEFTLSAFPLGGYVEIAGLAEVGQGTQEEAHRTDKHAFSTKPYYQKMIILIGGITFNLIFAFLAFWAIFMIGSPKTPLLYPANSSTTIQKIKPDATAVKAGLQAGDTIIAVNGTIVKGDLPALIATIQSRGNQTVQVTIERAGTQQAMSIPLETHTVNGKTVGTLNAQFELIAQPRTSFLNAAQKGALLTWFWIKNTAYAYANLLTTRNTKNMSGPLSIFEASIKGAAQGLAIFLALLAIISINLAILNLIPLPIADGGQMVIQTLEAIIRRQLPLRLKEYIFFASWLAIIGLAIYLSAKDILRMVGSHVTKLFH